MKPSRKTLPLAVHETVLVPRIAPAALRGRSPSTLIRLTEGQINTRLDGFHAGPQQDVWLCSADGVFVEGWTPESVQRTLSGARSALSAHSNPRRLGILLAWKGHHALRSFLLRALTSNQADMSAQTAQQSLQTLRSPSCPLQLCTLASRLWRQGDDGFPQCIDPHISALMVSGLKLVGVVSEGTHPTLLFLESTEALPPRPGSPCWQLCAA